MNMLGEIEKLFNKIDISTDYRLINIGGERLYVEGVRALGYLANDNIVLRLKNKVLNIVGKDLTIKYLDRTSSVIEGKIISMEVK